jgi:hypothetical protein
MRVGVVGQLQAHFLKDFFLTDGGGTVFTVLTRVLFAGVTNSRSGMPDATGTIVGLTAATTGVDATEGLTAAEPALNVGELIELGSNTIGGC